MGDPSEEVLQPCAVGGFLGGEGGEEEEGAEETQLRF